MQDNTYSSLSRTENTENTYSSTHSSDRYYSEESRPVTRTPSRQPKKKKATTVTLTAALIACAITFIVGIVISSAIFTPGELKDAKNTIKSQEEEIVALEAELDSKNEANIALGEKIQEQLATIESLENGEESPVTSVLDEPAAPAEEKDVLTKIADLSTTQQILLFVALGVALIFIISITCSFISSHSYKKHKKSDKKTDKVKKADKKETVFADEYNDEAPAEDNDIADTQTIPPISEASVEGEASEEEPDSDMGTDSVVDEAIDLLYHNNLEDNISDLGGFKFGITNFEEILSDKTKAKSFGNAENGDFVAFMAVKASVKKLFIIPRYMTLSDSSVALRGTTDLFSICDEAGIEVTHGTVKIKTIDAPSVFAFGENGWAIESKGKITALGSRH